jgi:multisubunit Na+/H+ antiporter MnhG subunit
LAYAGVALFFQIGPMLNHGRYKPDYYPLGHIVLILAGICLLVGAGIATTTAVDLWKFSARGRSLAMTGASILGIFALLVIVRRPVWDLELGVLALVAFFSVEVIVYLSLPVTRSQFESKPPV